jgi:membrane carboxypeptidase/penicillin-binding protein
VGGKTGTTNENRDAWFLGITPSLAAGVWVGYDTPRPLPRAAAGMALPVWARIMRRAMAGFPPVEFVRRTDLVEVTVDAYSGMKAGPWCVGALKMWFRPDEAPTETCTRDHTGERFQILMQSLMDSLAAEAEADSSGAAPVEGVPAADSTAIEAAP